jgi:hypothetical protein
MTFAAGEIEHRAVAFQPEFRDVNTEIARPHPLHALEQLS